jgi:beta-glucosidase
MDFIGANIYMVHAFVQATDAAPGYEVVAGGGFTPPPFRPFPKGYPRAVYPGSNETIVFNLSPEAMYWGTRQLVDVWGTKEIFVTESGMPTTAEGDAGGDVDRIVWLRALLTQLQRATAEGVPVRGYFHWSLMDNLEWIFGYEPKFGLFRTDMKTLQRTPKLSAQWLGEMAKLNAMA